MISKIRKTHDNDQQIVQTASSANYVSKKKDGWKAIKTLTAAMGFLAAAQNAGVASARPLGPSYGLSLPKTSGFGGRLRDDWATKTVNEMEVHTHKPELKLLEMGEVGEIDRKSRMLLDNHGATYIANVCVETLIARTEYDNFWTDDEGMGSTEIPPTKAAKDTYSNEPTTAFASPHVNVFLKLKGYQQETTVNIKADQSIVAIDAGDFKGCNIYLSKRKHIYTPNDNKVLEYVGPG